MLTRLLACFCLLASAASATYLPTITGNITVSSSALPSGAAISANQISGGPQTGSGIVTSTTQRVTLASDGPEVTNSTAIKNSVAAIPAKGAATIANSMPVTLASDQVVKVAGTTTDIIVTPVVTTSAYASGNCIGGASAGGSAILSLANAVRGSGVQSGTIQSLTINCKIVNTAQIDVLFFGASPSGTATDKVAVALASNALGIISVSNWISMGTYSTGTQTGQPLSFVLPSGTTLYAVMVIRGLLTPTSSSDITLSARIIQD